jgi:hypothetical protein
MSIIQDVSFAGPLGQQLAGKLHLPQGSYRGVAIFAPVSPVPKKHWLPHALQLASLVPD